MKTNFLTAVLAIVMVMIATGALYVAMTMYETDNFDENWMLSPTVIEMELKPLYSEEFDVNSKEY